MPDESKKQIIIEIHPEFLELLKRVEEKIKHTTWDGMDKISYKTLTKILARKIKALKIF